MTDFWQMVTFVGLSVASGWITAILCMVLWGVGGLRSLGKRLTAVEDEADQANKRITKEVKARASDAGVAARRRMSDAELTAAALEATPKIATPPQASSWPGKPSLVGRK